MHLIKTAAMVSAIMFGALLAHGSATASSLATGTMAAAKSDDGLIRKAWHYGRPHYRSSRYYGRRNYRGRSYRPRIVCRIQYRTVRTAYGRLVRRPVEVCRRRY
jgi:hypothetical protein